MKMVTYRNEEVVLFDGGVDLDGGHGGVGLSGILWEYSSGQR